MTDQSQQPKFYIPHRILVINSQVTKSEEDRVLSKCYRKAFDWANRMGLQGKRVFDLFLEDPNSKNYDPLCQHLYLWCKIECTESERKKWKEYQEESIKIAIMDALKDE